MKTFDNISTFVAELVAQAARIERYAQPGLERAAQVIEDAAKAEFGVYQDEVGRFPAWAELADATKADRVAQGYSENEPLLRSGDLRESVSHEVHGLEAVIGSDDDIMVYQEMGTETIPPRPVLGPAAVRTEHRVAKILGAAVAEGMLYLTPGSLEEL